MPEQITVQDLIRREAQARGVPPELALAVAEQESGFDPTQINPTIVEGESSGAVGTFQFLPSVAKARGFDPHDPVENIRGGVGYLRELLDRHNGDLNKVLSEYGGVKTNTTYVPGVLGRVKKFTVAPVAQVGAPPPAPPPPRAAAPSPAPTPSLTAQLVQGFNPARREGRRNIAGAIGGLAGGILAAPTAALSGPVGPALGATLGAMAAGGLVEGGEALIDRLVGTAPPGQSIVAQTGKAMTEQGLYEAGGRAIVWPLRATWRRLITPRIGQHVRETLRGALERASDAIRTIHLQTTARTAGIKAGTEAAVGGLERQLAQVPGGPPAPTVGRLVNKVVQGPAKSALDQAGELVERSAETGPPVDLTPVKQKLTEVVAQFRPPGPAQPSVIGARSRALMSPEMLQQLAAVEEAHPVRGLLGQLQEIPDQIPFAEAHRIKRLLDETVNWASPARKLVQQATKGVRQSLREAMSGHTPYEEATKAYADLIPLYRKGLAPKLRTQIAENPEILVNAIKAHKPTEVQFIKDLLLTQAPKGGGEAEGKAAWDALRSEWTYQRVIKGSVEKLGDRLAKVQGPFAQVFYDDQAGQQVLGNLQSIAHAYEQAITRSKASLEGAKRAGAAAVGAQQEGMRQIRQTAAAFRASSLGRPYTIENTITDAARATLLAPQSAWQNVSMIRLFIHGPKVPELIQWAAFSSQGTQRLVRLLASPQPGEAFADLLRTPGFLEVLVDDEEMPTSATIGQPPPAPARPLTGVGSAPPR